MGQFEPDSKVADHYNPEVYDTPLYNNPAYGSVTITLQLDSHNTSTHRITRRQAFELHAALGEYLGLGQLIETQEGLDAQPVGTTVEDVEGDFWSKWTDGVWRCDSGLAVSDSVHNYLPVRVHQLPATLKTDDVEN